MEKEGKVNFKFISSVIFFSLIFALIVFAVSYDDTLRIPTDGGINTTRNVNFTFNVTWDAPGQAVGNCSLYTNYTGTWQSELEFNGSNEGDVSANISNASISWINFTLDYDVPEFRWGIACRNGSSGDATNLTFTSNRTLSVDTIPPKVIQSEDIYSGFNTTDETPTITINITDLNGTGVDITGSGNSSLNVTLYIAGTGTLLRSYNASNENLSCTSSSNGTQATQCTLDVSAFPFTNGTKNITITTSDRAGNNNESSFTFTVDQIPPALISINFTNASSFSGANVESVLNGTRSIRQGEVIYLTTNITDNLTQPLNISFQFYNTSNNAWVVADIQRFVDASGSGYSVNEGRWGNASYTIPSGHNMFEDANITFRVIYNDTLGNLNTSANFTVQVNDSTGPSITITSPANISNTTDTTPTFSFTPTDLSGTEITCNLILDDVINMSFNETSGSTISNLTTPIGDGKHNWSVNCSDFSGNIYSTGNITVSVDTTAPTIAVTLVNNSNVTSRGNITVTTGDSTTAVRTNQFSTSCGASGNFTNGTAFFPFNDSSGACTGAFIRTLTINATDSVGNSNVSKFLYGVDVTAPILTVVTPSNGEEFRGTNVTFNLTSLEGFLKTSFFGYYLDGGNNLIQIDFDANGLGETGLVVARNLSLNSTGTHTVIFTVNDTVGNSVNSSSISFTQTGPIIFSEVANSIQSNINNTFGTTFFNVTTRIKTDSGNFEAITATNDTDNIFEIIFEVAGGNNITIADFNGTAANWDRINFTPFINNTPAESHVQNNWSNNVINSTWFNGSIDEFISNANSYYGIVVMPFIINESSNQTTVQEFWWIEDETDFSLARVNITQCTSVFTKTATSPCWNYTDNGKSIIYVPSFSMVLAVNDTDAPTINVTTPIVNQTVSMFVPNITVSADSKSCKYQLNSSSPSNVTMTKTGNVCIGDTERFKNLEAAPGYNVTFFVTDYNGNLNEYVFQFNVSDLTKPNDPNGTRVSSIPGTATSSVTISEINESVNVTITYGQTISVNTSVAMELDFNTTQVVSLSGLSEGTLYYFNVTVCDYNGNCAKNGTFNFTTSTSGSSSSSSSSSSGGGGGGGAVSSSNVASSKAQVWAVVPAGSSIAMNVDSGAIAVTKIAVNDAKSELKNVDLEVQALNTNPVSEAAAGKTYQYLFLKKKNVADSDVGSIKINFRVTKTWLAENGLGSADISLYRYKDGVWNELSTSVTSSDATYVNYEAETPGFSYFAVAASTSVVGAPAEETPEETTPGEETPTEGETTPPETATTPKPVEAPSKSPVTWVILALVVILAIVLIVVYQKRKQEV